MDKTPQFPEIPVKEEKVNYENIISLQKKKNAVRKELHERGILPKGAHNDYDNYDYFSEAQYKELFTELFSKHGIEIIIDEADYGTFDGTDKQPFGRVVTLACTLIDIDTGYAETSRHTGEGLDRGDKAGYKATTGAIKKFLSKSEVSNTESLIKFLNLFNTTFISSAFFISLSLTPVNKKTYSRTTSKVTKLPTNCITRGQLAMIKSLFKDSKEELKEMMNPYNKKKIEELTMEEASQIIESKKGTDKDE